MDKKDDDKVINTKVLVKAVPKERLPHIIEALDEVDEILKGKKPIKSARQFLNELKEEK